MVGIIVTLSSVVILLSSYVHVNSTELGSTVEFIVIEQMKFCISPTTLCSIPLGCKETLEAGATNNYKIPCN